jgi:single-strand DNA-binding protein
VAITNEPLAKIAEQYLRKGSTVYIEGQLETRKWTDQAGVEKYTTEIVLRPFRGELTLLGGKTAGSDDDAAREEYERNRQRPGSESSGGSGYGDGPNSGGRDDMDSEIPF